MSGPGCHRWVRAGVRSHLRSPASLFPFASPVTSGALGPRLYSPPTPSRPTIPATASKTFLYVLDFSCICRRIVSSG